MGNGLLWTVLLSTGLAVEALAAVTPFNDTLTVLASGQRKAPAMDAVTTIVIDAGHGGHDAGCSGKAHGAREKTIALQLALGLGDQIQRSYPDLKVIYTRDRDVFVPLHERAAIANRAQADLFISIHCNAMPSSSKVAGSETYVMGLHTAQHNLDVAKRENAAIRLERDTEQHYDFDPDSPTGHIILSMFQHAFLEQSMVLAASIEDQLAERNGHRSRGVKQAGFLVLKETAMPSVLVETGYLTNATEEAYLNSSAGQAETVQSLFEGVESYMQRRRSSGSEVQPLLASLQISEPSNALLAGMTEPAGPLVAPVGKTDAGGVAFYVQLAASSRQLETSGPKWSRLGSPVRYVREGDFYKYQAGPFATRAEAMAVHDAARLGDFPGAFLTAYRFDEKLSAEELRRHQR